MEEYNRNAIKSKSSKGGFKCEDTWWFLRLRHKYSKSLSWAEDLNKLLTVLSGKFKFSAQDSDLEYYLVSSDLKPPLVQRCEKNPEK